MAVEVAVADGTERPDGGTPARTPDPVLGEKLPPWKKFWRWWGPKATRIAGIQNRALAWLTYWLGLGPVAFLSRGQDRLDRATRPAAPSAWHPRTEPIPVDPQRIRRPV